MKRVKANIRVWIKRGVQSVFWGMTGYASCVLAQSTATWNSTMDGRWQDPANWQSSIVGNGANVTVLLTNTTASTRTILVDAPATLWYLRSTAPANSRWRFIGDGGLIFDGSSMARLGIANASTFEFFTPLVSTNGQGIMQDQVQLNLDFNNINRSVNGPFFAYAYTVRQDFSRAAEHAASLVQNHFPTAGVIQAGAYFQLRGRKNASANTATWSMMEGSAVITSTSTNGTAALTAGQVVDTANFPAGTFIRSIYDSSNLLMSAAAVASSTSSLTFAAASFNTEQLLQRVRLENPATISLFKNSGSSFTVTAERVYGNYDFSLRDSDATLVISGQREHRGSLVFAGGDVVLKPRSIVRRPAAHPAFHVDASRADTLTLVNGNEVSEWRDCTGRDLAARPPSSRPTVMTNELNGLPVIDFGPYGVSPYMHWYTTTGQVQLTAVRTVFWVLGSQNGGGFLLGATNTAHFHRGSNPDYPASGNPNAGTFDPIKISSKVWGHDAGSYPGFGRMTTYIDGIRWGTGNAAALNGGYQTITLTVTTNCTAGGFATDRSSFATRRGGQRLAEVIIYERELSEVERLETEEYLMQKWFGAARSDATAADPVLNNLTAIDVRTLWTPDAGTVTVNRLAGGGRLTKKGASALVLNDAQDYQGTLVMSSSKLSLGEVKKVPVALPTNAYFHVDASKLGSLIVDGSNGVQTWNDWRTNGLSAGVPATGSCPLLQTNALSGKPVVSFGVWGSNQSLFWNHTNTQIYAVFLVFQSVASGASILGSVDAAKQMQEFQREESTGRLFTSDTSRSSAAVAFGKAYVNGLEVVPHAYALPSGFNVIAALPTTPAKACAFASRFNYTTNSGGQRIAEAVIYTRKLTDREVSDASAYLMYKWLKRAAPGYGAADASKINGVLYTGDEPLEIHVSGDGEAAIGQVTSAKNIIKTGSGLLSIGGRASGFSGTIQVREGGIGSGLDVADQPAPSPVFHVDASRADTLTLSLVNGTNFVTRWASLAGESNAAVSRAGFANPFVRTNDLAGRNVIDFGAQGVGGGLLQWEKESTSVRTVFTVLGSQAGGSYVLGHTGSPHFHRGSNPRTGTLLPIEKANPIYGYDVAAGIVNGQTYVDGVLVNPLTQAFSGEWQLINTCTTLGLSANLFAGDRSYADRAGGQRLAEVIVYDRALSETERLQTERYLRKKWLGQSLRTAYIGSVALEGAQPTLVAEGDRVMIQRVQGTGRVQKTGSGIVSVRDWSAFTGTVAVTQGALELGALAAPHTLPSNTLFHVDASAPDTVQTDSNGAVIRWSDCSGNGRFATNYVRSVLPTLTRDELVGPVIDLGVYGAGAGMRFNERLGFKSMLFVMNSRNSGGYLLGSDGTAFHRGRPPNGGEIATTNFSYLNKIYDVSWGALIPSSAYTNDVAIDTTVATLSGGWQLHYQSWNGGTYADGFAFDRSIPDRFGGQQIAEFVAYDRVLTESERRDAQAYLQAKWYNQRTAGYTVAPVELGVELHPGARLLLNNETQSIASLSGEGTVASGAVTVRTWLSPGLVANEPAVLAVDGDFVVGNGIVWEVDATAATNDCIAVSGQLSVNGGGRIVLRTVTAGTRFLPLATFSSRPAGTSAGSWEIEGVPAGYTGHVEWSDTALMLAIRPSGSLVILR